MIVVVIIMMIIVILNDIMFVSLEAKRKKLKDSFFYTVA